MRYEVINYPLHHEVIDYGQDRKCVFASRRLEQARLKCGALNDKWRKALAAGLRVYLCGPINGRSDDDCKGWREAAKEKLLNTCDPMDRDYRGRELEPGIAKEIVELDKKDIDGCDVILVYFDKPSVGTSMEVHYAFERGKRIVLVNKSDKPLSPWLIYHCSEIVTTIEAGAAACLKPQP